MQNKKELEKEQNYTDFAFEDIAENIIRVTRTRRETESPAYFVFRENKLKKSKRIQKRIPDDGPLTLKHNKLNQTKTLLSHITHDSMRHYYTKSAGVKELKTSLEKMNLN